MIGILALQGSFKDHRASLKRFGAESVLVRRPADLDGLTGLIIPGGESTAIRKLACSAGLIDPLAQMFSDGLPVWGTCAGAVLLCRDGLWPLIDAEISRNAYGPQLYSQTAKGQLQTSGITTEMIFIRAPRFKALHQDIMILARYENEPVAVRQKNVLLTTFHPELSDDAFFTSYFLEMAS